jgi:ribosomal-protein-serine acetyltransferase
MFYLAIDENIQLRTLHPEDAQILFQLVERNRARLRPWIHPSALPETMPEARILTIESFFNSLANPMKAMLEYEDYFRELDHYFPLPNPPMEMGIWMNADLVGEIMLGRLQDSFGAAEFGYWIDGQREGLGIITRCVSGLMDYAIDNMGIARFVIGCAFENQRSRSIPERLGYRLLARVPGGEIVGDTVYDRVIYGLRSDDWRRREKGTRLETTIPGGQLR